MRELGRRGAKKVVAGHQPTRGQGLVEVDAQDVQPKSSVPINLGLVVDASRSMSIPILTNEQFQKLRSMGMARQAGKKGWFTKQRSGWVVSAAIAVSALILWWWARSPRRARLLLRLVRDRESSECELFSREDMGAMLGITTETTSRTTQEIIRANVVTRFNILLGILLVIIVVFVSEPSD